MLVFHAIWFTRSVSRVSSLSPTPTPPPDMRETTACKVSHFRWSVTIKNKASPPSPSFILLFTKYCCCFWIPPNSYKWERYSFICEEIGSATWSLGFSSTYSWQDVLLIAMFAMMITMIIAMMYHWLGPTCSLGFSSIYSWQGGNEVSLPRPGLDAQMKYIRLKRNWEETCCRCSHISECRISPKAWYHGIFKAHDTYNGFAYMVLPRI